MSEPETLQAQAAGWFARERSGAMDGAERQALDAWLTDPAHRAAYDAVARAWASVAVTRSAPEILAIRAEARRRPAPPWRRAAWPRIAAACVALAVVGAVSLFVGREAGVVQSRALKAEVYRTALGERSTMTLRDGTVVTLNTDTVLRTESAAGKRLVYLDKGQAFFRVAKDPRRPFVVTAAGRTITALGTAFDVRVDGAFEVTLVEGKVKVETKAAAARSAAVQATEMLPGSQLVASADQAWRVAPTDTGKETSWLTGWLDFDNEPLGQVAAEFNRYSPRKIVVEDAALAATPVSGRFEAGDVEAFTRALENYEIARVDIATPAAITLSAP